MSKVCLWFLFTARRWSLQTRNRVFMGLLCLALAMGTVLLALTHGCQP